MRNRIIIRERTLLLGVALLVALACNGWATVIYVDDDAPAGGDGSAWQNAFTYLQDALTAASTADKPVEIRVAQGIYKPDRGVGQTAGDRLASFDLFSGVALKGGYTGLAMPDPNVRDTKLYETVLSGDLAGNDVEVSDPNDLDRLDPTRSENSCHVVQIVRASDVRLEGLTIASGRADLSKRGEYATTLRGGGVYTADSDGLTFRNCSFRGNYAGNGGACSIDSCTDVTMEDCTINRNAAVSGGGLAGGEAVTLSRCAIRENYARTSGGGISAGGSERAPMTLVDCVLGGNVADYSGGAARIFSPSTVRMSGCVIKGNSALNGGGIHAEGKSQEFSRCCFAANRAANEGGGLLLTAGMSNSRVLLSNCLLNGNRAEGGGAILGWFLGGLTMVNCTATENKAMQGGFLLCKAGPFPGMDMGKVSIANSIIWNNANALTTEDSCVSICYSDIPDDTVSFIDPNNNVTWGIGNIDVDPCFAVPGYWDSNGTPDDPNDDFFVEGDYRLKSQAGRWDAASQSWVMDDVTSPCIDAGDPNSPIGLEPFPNGGRINMGAYGGTAEASKSYFSEAVGP